MWRLMGGSAQRDWVFHSCDSKCAMRRFPKEICARASAIRLAANLSCTPCCRPAIRGKGSRACSHFRIVQNRTSSYRRCGMPLHHYGCISGPGRLVCALWFHRPEGYRRKWSPKNVSRHKNSPYGTEGLAVDLSLLEANAASLFILRFGWGFGFVLERAHGFDSLHTIRFTLRPFRGLRCRCRNSSPQA